MQNYLDNFLNRFQKVFKGDPIIWFVVFALSLWGILAVYSATGTLAFKTMQGNTESYLIKHSVLVLLGLVMMWVAHNIDYRFYAKVSTWLLYISVPLLLFAIAYGSTINDASRWITIPFIQMQFQPSDVAKLALVSSLSYMLSKSQTDFTTYREFISKKGSLTPDGFRETRTLFKNKILKLFLWPSVLSGLIAYSNFSTGIMLFITCMLLLLLGRVPKRFIMGVVLVGAIIFVGAFAFGQRGATFKRRIESFMSKKEVPFQAEQSFIAIANGGVIGLGPGNSRQKDFLPHPYSDFIFAIMLEEYGMIGGIIIVGLYVLLLYRGMVAAASRNNAFGALLSAGLSFSLCIQSFIHMAVSVGLMPITGQTLPLISMGGTSLLFTGITFGIILSVSRGERDPVFSAQRQNNRFTQNV